MTVFIATLAPDKFGNWEVCKREGLWGLVGRGTNWRSNGEKVRAGDTIYVWRGGRPNGFIAQLEALGRMRLPGEPGVSVPWDEPGWFGGVIPMRVVSELSAPVSDRFPNENGRIGLTFGFNNTVLQHIFEEIAPQVATKIAVIFPSTDSAVGRPFGTPERPKPTTQGLPFDVDPNAVDRALASHFDTVAALAEWVQAQGWEPRLPLSTEPQYDLAWETSQAIYVAEVKSTTAANQEMQLRLGLGQVLRYRHRLSDRKKKVKAWLVADRAVSDKSWTTSCSDVGVRLTWPGNFRSH